MRHQRRLLTAPPWPPVVTKHQPQQPQLTTLRRNTSSRIFLVSLETSSSLRSSQSHRLTALLLPKTAVMQHLKTRAMLHLRIVPIRLLKQLVMRHPRKTIIKLQRQKVMKPQKLKLTKLQRLKLMKPQRLRLMKFRRLRLMKLQKPMVTMLLKKVVTLPLKTPHLLTWCQPMKNLRFQTQKSTLQSMKDQTQCNNCCHFPDMTAQTIPVVICACWLHRCLQGFPVIFKLGSSQVLRDLQHETTYVVDVD